jgi:hypothetical protein
MKRCEISARGGSNIFRVERRSIRIAALVLALGITFSTEARAELFGFGAIINNPGASSDSSLSEAMEWQSSLFPCTPNDSLLLAV